MTEEKPIKFTTEMVRATIAGNMTTMRHVIKSSGNKMHHGKLLCDWGLSKEPQFQDGVVSWELQTDVDDSEIFITKCPWEVGQILWVREWWRDTSIKPHLAHTYTYQADWSPAYVKNSWPWNMPLHMPRRAARLFLKVKNIRVERLQDITGRDVLAEGIDNGKSNPTMGERWENMQRLAFQELWDERNSERGYGWDLNPWVFVVEFEVQP